MSKKIIDEEEHTPFWPRWLEKAFIQRKLAFWKDNTLWTEDEQVFPIATFQEYFDTVMEQNLLVFTDKLLDFPYLPELIEQGEVHCTKHAVPTSAKLTGQRNTTRWLCTLEPWGPDSDGFPRELSFDFLQDLRALYTLMQNGTHGSPGGQGQAFWRRIWSERGFHRHYAPCKNAVRFIRDKANAGGRADMPGERNEPYPELDSIDRIRGYPAEFGALPTGTAERILAGGKSMHSANFDGLREWVCDVRVTIVKKLKWAIFHVKDTLGAFFRPTEPGIYDTTLWRCEAEQAEREGCLVECFDGYGWHRSTNDHTAVVAIYEELLEQCPAKIKGLFKTTFLSGMGRFGMGNEHYQLVASENKTDTDRPITLDDGLQLDVFLRKIIDEAMPQMIHWFACICARMRVALTEQVLAMIDAGVTVLYDNFDEIGAEPHPYFDQFPEKSSTLPTGSWGVVRYRDVYLEKNRWFKGWNVKTGKYRGTTPGEPKARSA